jgi:hypothetical protein
LSAPRVKVLSRSAPILTRATACYSIHMAELPSFDDLESDVPRWHVVYENVLPYVVAVETPDGSGTGFFFAYNADKSFVAFATAAHVVQHAHSWRQPIKLRHHVSGNEIFVAENDRYIELDRNRDSASIVIRNPGDYLPTKSLPMMDSESYKRIGIEVAWVGYPAIVHPNLCLFTGRISAFINFDDSYLIDGVAINGVSGGPVFARLSGETPELIGLISAYMPNRQRDYTLPGMLQAHDVTAFHQTILTFKSFDEALKKQQEEDQQRRQAEAAGEVPPSTQLPPVKEPNT